MIITSFTIVIEQATAAPAAPPAARASDPFTQEIRNALREAQAAGKLHEGVTIERGTPGHPTRITINGAGTPTPPPIPEFGTLAGSPSADVIPQQAVDLAYGFMAMCAIMVIGWPLARAFGRRIERRGEAATISPAITEQLRRIEQGVEAMSIEVERISESQRFMARLQGSSSTERV